MDYYCRENRFDRVLGASQWVDWVLVCRFRVNIACIKDVVFLVNEILFCSCLLLRAKCKRVARFANRDGKPPANRSHCSVNGIKSVQCICICAVVTACHVGKLVRSFHLFKLHWNIIFILFRVESEPGRHMCSCVMNSNPKWIRIETCVVWALADCNSIWFRNHPWSKSKDWFGKWLAAEQISPAILWKPDKCSMQFSAMTRRPENESDKCK